MTEDFSSRINRIADTDEIRRKSEESRTIEAIEGWQALAEIVEAAFQSVEERFMLSDRTVQVSKSPYELSLVLGRHARKYTLRYKFDFDQCVAWIIRDGADAQKVKAGDMPRSSVEDQVASFLSDALPKL